MGKCNEMKEQNKILVTILVLVIIILSIFAAFLEYRFGIFAITGDGKLPFTAKIFADEKEGLVPFSVNFTSIVQHYEGNLEYSWDFGDGKTSKEINPSHKYEETGDYTCRLVVTDSRGKKSSDSIKLSVKRNKPPVVTLSINQNTLERKFIPILSILPLWPGDIQKILNNLEKRDPNIFGEGTIVCNAQIDDPEDDEIVSYRWVHIAETQLSQFGKPEQPIHYFEGNESIRLPEIYTWPMGRHVVTLTVEDSAGNTANATIEFQVEQSLKIIQKNQMKSLIKGTINQWLLVFNPFIGPLAAGLLLAMWKYNNFEGVKLVTLFLLQFIFQLDMDDAFMIQFKAFLDNHPIALKIVDLLLIKMQQIFKNQDIEAIRESLGLANNRPKIFNPFPEDETNNIPIDIPYVAINVSDLEGDPFNITISGEYVNNVTYTDVTNGTFIATLITPLPEREEIFWNVEVVDPRGKIVTGEYKFTTFVEI